MGGCISQGFGRLSHWTMAGIGAERDVARCTMFHGSRHLGGIGRLHWEKDLSQSEQAATISHRYR